MAEPTYTSDQIKIAEHPQIPLGKPLTRVEQVRAVRGKFAWIPFSSDDHIREKHEELEREEH